MRYYHAQTMGFHSAQCIWFLLDLGKSDYAGLFKHAMHHLLTVYLIGGSFAQN